MADRWSRERIVVAIQQWTAENGSPPTAAMWARGGIPRDRFPAKSTVIEVFGSWNVALTEAGALCRRTRWPRERIVVAIQQWTAEHGSPPTCRTWGRSASPYDYPVKTTVMEVFGSWNAALTEAGVGLSVRERRWTRESVIAAIQEWSAQHGCPPRPEVWARAGVPRDRFPSTSLVQKVCGSWHKALDDASVLPVREQRWRNLDPAFGHWLAGLIDGEGCFTVSRQSHGYGARFRLSLRDDDAAILKEIHVRLGLGTLGRRERSRRVNAKPCLEWTVESRPDAEELVEILDRYPLRSKKAADYTVWKRAVKVSSAMPYRTRAKRDWGPLIELKQQLESVRQYRPSAGGDTDRACARAR